jgi:SAM-dependent methyltransferase
VNYQRLYEYRFRGIDQRAREEVWREIALYLHGRLGAPERVLDPAAGRGEFISAVPARERWAVDAVAYDEQAADAGVRRITADVLSAELPTDYFDAVFVSNFLEHLPDHGTVAAFLEKMHGVLRPGGRVAVIGPNFRYCAAEYFDCADHVLALTHVAVAEQLYAAGFDVRSVVPRFLPYSFRGLLPPSAALTRYYLRVRPAWALLGKQFLVIARRDAASAA